MQTKKPISSLQSVNTPPETETPISKQPIATKNSAKWLLVGLVILLFGTTSVFAYKYYGLKRQLDNQQLPPSVSTPEETTATASPTPISSNWKIYRNEEYGFELRHPPTWKMYEAKYFVQIQVVDGEEVTAIAGGIDIISKGIDSPYLKMYTSDSRCPDSAGRRDLSSSSQYEAYEYCLTGDEVETSSGVWKGAVECSTTLWGTGGDFNDCAHQFWLDTKDFLFVVQFNYFQPIKKNSEEALLFETFLKGFSFFTPSD